MVNASQPSVMSHDFSRVPSVEIQRSSLRRNHGYKTTFDAGYLIPVFFDEVLPGDTAKLRMRSLTRLATPLHPFMDNVFLNTFFFAVPIRLVWDNWEKFNGEQDDPGDSTDFLTPQIEAPAGGHLEGSLSDYFGIPTQVDPLTHSAFWHRAYNLIWNQWFRDQNQQQSLPVPKDDGPDDPTTYKVQRRGKRHDYFTSALPWPQKGPAVQLPLSGNAPVIGLAKDNQLFDAGVGDRYETGGTGPTTYTNDNNIHAASRNVYMEEDPNNAGFPGVFADLTDVNATSINELRESFQVQRMFEKDARSGSRYTEIVKGHFGVSSPDERLQRAEYLGGGQSMVNIDAVAQTSTSGTDVAQSDTPQGNLAAVGTSVAHGHGFSKSFTEHCVVIGLISARADLNYQQGLDRMWSRNTRFDYYWPSLAHLGEQAVLNQEIFADGSANDALTFGFQERFAEMRYKRSVVTGAFRSNAALPLDTWHLSQDFDNLPTLSPEFIEDDPPISRVVAVPTEPQFLFDAYFDYTMARPMPMYGVPGLIDHF